jgi:general secretion pathway protein A
MLQTVLELETTARLVAVLLVSGRAVVNEHQDVTDSPVKADKGFTPDVFERELAEAFLLRLGIDLRGLDSAWIPARARNLLASIAAASKPVVTDAHSQLNQPGVGFKRFIPAVFGTRVASRLAETTGAKLKQTALVPRNPSNAPDTFEEAALQVLAEPSHSRDTVMTELVSGSRCGLCCRFTPRGGVWSVTGSGKDSRTGPATHGKAFDWVRTLERSV